jgi:hypothetical protein
MTLLYIATVVLEIVALVTGIISRKTYWGKRGLIISATTIGLGVLFVTMFMPWGPPETSGGGTITTTIEQ